jgi:hypothetical protein
MAKSGITMAKEPRIALRSIRATITYTDPIALADFT